MQTDVGGGHVHDSDPAVAKAEFTRAQDQPTKFYLILRAAELLQAQDESLAKRV